MFGVAVNRAVTLPISSFPERTDSRCEPVSNSAVSSVSSITVTGLGFSVLPSFHRANWNPSLGKAERITTVPSAYSPEPSTIPVVVLSAATERLCSGKNSAVSSVSSITVMGLGFSVLPSFHRANWNPSLGKAERITIVLSAYSPEPFTVPIVASFDKTDNRQTAVNSAVKDSSDSTVILRGFSVFPSLHRANRYPTLGVAEILTISPSSYRPPPDTLPFSISVERTIV